VLNERLFEHLNPARRIVEAWRIDDKMSVAPHTSLNRLAPIELADRSGWTRTGTDLLTSERNKGMESDPLPAAKREDGARRVFAARAEADPVPGFTRIFFQDGPAVTC
jgi:hypothetical protein